MFRIRGLRRAALSACAALALAVGALLVTAGAAQAGTSLPCDIYGAAGTPCVAAHSTIRALYGSYNGPLYQVQRASDSAYTDIGLLSTGGYANAAAQDSFCAGTRCTITRIYDQSPRRNDLTIEASGGVGGQDAGAPADALPVSVGGETAYGVEISPGMGYRDDATSGVAVNGQPEGMYMVTSGTHVNAGCCFDYGNAETNNHDTGNGHMDAINYSTACWNPPCYGPGPWVQADMENGLYQASNGSNSANTGTGPLSFVTALLKNNGQNYFALKQANAQSGGLTTTYSGPEPNLPGYSPMHQEGAIVLGTGGDNSNSSIGNFYEGVMTAGVPSDSADDAVQANIVTVGYGSADGIAAGSLTPGSPVSLRATTGCCTGDYIRHQSGQAILSQITTGSPALDKADATWIVRRGLANNTCVSFESYNYPGDYLRHSNYTLYKQPDDGSGLFANDATFCPQPGNSGLGTSFHAQNYPDHFIRHYNGNVYIASDGGPNPQDSTTSWNDDTSWVVSQPWALTPSVTSQPVVGAGSGRCLDINGFGTADGTAVQLYDCSGNWNQQWSYTGGQLLNPYTGKCLDVAGGATANSTAVRLWTCNNAGAQQWKVTPSGNLVNTNSGRCLDVTGWATANGSPLEIWDCGNSQTNQTWSLGPHQVAGAGSNRCLDIQNFGSADGTPVQLWDCSGNTNQQWTLQQGQLVNPSTGKCLDVAGGATADGTQVRLWTCNGLGAQQWQAQPDGTLVNPEAGKCLDVTAWNTADGSPLEIWDCGNHQANQTWALK